MTGLEGNCCGECRPYGTLHFGRLSQRLRAGLMNCAPPELRRWTLCFGSAHARDVRGGFGECRPYGTLHFGRLSQRLRAGLMNYAPPELRDRRFASTRHTREAVLESAVPTGLFTLGDCPSAYALG